MNRRITGSGQGRTEGTTIETYQVRDAVAVITLNNPPVNGLNYAQRSAIVDGIDRAQADAGVKAIVLIGAGTLFSGGADIREFNTPAARA